MELIYKDKLLEAIDNCDYCDHCRLSICLCVCGNYITEGAIVNLIKDTPAVDAVEVDRCKDCKWWGNELDLDGHIVGGCYFFDKITAADGYCYHGERKEVMDENA